MRILKIESLPPKSAAVWIDRDEIMLHACFQLLKDCVEKENVDTHVNYEAHKDFVDEVRFLYNWWIKRRTRREELFSNLSNPLDKEDDKMLIRLMKIRTGLWT
jgi:hypothetical protein